MEAIVTPMLRFLQGPKQFFIPIFQRMYRGRTTLPATWNGTTYCGKI